MYENIGWRWLYYLQLILCGTLFLLMLVCVPETHAPVLLEWRAKKLRKATGDDSYRGEHELAHRTFAHIAQVHLARPLRLLLTEPIVTMFSLYAAILYGLLYMFFVAYVSSLLWLLSISILPGADTSRYPIVFEEGKGMSPGIAGLMFLPVTGGVVIGLIGAPLINRQYLRLRAKHTGHPPPELRLIPMMWSCFFIPVGLFIVSACFFLWAFVPLSPFSPLLTL